MMQKVEYNFDAGRLALCFHHFPCLILTTIIISHSQFLLEVCVRDPLENDNPQTYFPGGPSYIVCMHSQQINLEPRE